MKKRIVGIDVARALAIIGMVIVNFKVTFGDHGDGWLKSIAQVFDGKAAATFVVLAGLGLALMTNSAIQNNDKEKIKRIRIRIAKRALFLFVIGLSWIVIFSADILHYYGIFMMVILLLLTSKNRTIISVAVALIVGYPVLMIIFDYETGWNFDTLTYQGFWTIHGFIRNLFFNGFHPVIPWTSFMLFGYWFGRQDLHNERFIKKTFLVNGTVFILIQVLSYLSIVILSGGDPESAIELQIILGTSPMPPFPIYMFNGVAIAFTVISGCIIIATRFPNNIIIDALMKTGQLALTLYVAHVIIGMGIIQSIDPLQMGEYSITFSLLCALIFSLLCILFSVLWMKHKKSGPLEWVMRKVTD